MPAHFMFHAYDVQLGITLPDRDMREDVLKYLQWTTSTLLEVDAIPPGTEATFDLQTAPDTTDLHLVCRNGVPLHVPVTWDILPQRLEIEIIVYLANTSPRFYFIHAGVVRWHGKVILMPGSSRVGKSTLVQALVQAGAEYYSDEFAVLDAEANIWPLARHLYQREGPYGPTMRVSFGHITPVMDASYTPPPVDIVLLASFNPATVWSTSPLTPSEAVVGMVRHVASMQTKPRTTLQVLSTIGEQATCWRCERPDVESAVNWLSELCPTPLEQTLP